MIPSRTSPGYSDYRPYNLYVAAYPHLSTFSDCMSSDNATVRQMANRRFCQAALRLAAPEGVTAQMLWDMAGVAEGGPQIIPSTEMEG